MFLKAIEESDIKAVNSLFAFVTNYDLKILIITWHP